MHLIRANLVCVCVFLIFFFENLKKIQSCPILHLPYKKPFIFSAFFIPDFLLFFIEYPFEMSVLDILFLENSQKTQFIYASLHDKYLAVMLLTIYQSSPPWEIVFYPLLFRKFQFHPSHCYGEFFLF